MKNNRILLVLFALFIPFLTHKMDVKADYVATVAIPDGAICELYSKSTGKCLYKNENLNSYVPGVIWMDNGEQLTVIESKPALNGNQYCTGKYVYTSYEFSNKPGTKYYGYFCDANLTTNALTNELKAEFSAAGFPESYWEKLALLKTVHPKWTFKAIKTGLDFNDSVSNEASLGRSLIQVSSSANNEGYLSTVSGAYDYYTDSYKAYDGTNWYNANEATIAYYMDPRNFFTDMYVFQYEALAYEKNLQTLDVVKQLLNGDYLSNFSSSYMSAANDSNVSPVYLASLSKQEVGGYSYATTAVSGKAFSYGGNNYSGIYNPYNIGATSGSDAVYKGLYWAAGSGSYTTYDRPWTSMDKAICGGAKWIGSNYISLGQNTSYFKKWNVVYNYNTSIANRYSNYNHQYMTNIQAPSQESRSNYSGYYNTQIINSSFVFYIPVYNNMPNETSLPNKGNQNNYLSSLTIDGKDVSAFDGATTNYNYYVGSTTNSVTINATALKNTSTVSGTGKITLTEANTTRDIIVKAENGATRTYKINIIKDTSTSDNTGNNTSNNNQTITDVLNGAGIKNGNNYITGLSVGMNSSIISGKITNINSNASVVIRNSNGTINSSKLKTGDTITVNIGNDSKTYTAVLYGDPSGDGVINAVDYVKIRNYIMGKTGLNSSYKEAADVDKNGVVNAVDYVKIRNYIMGKTTINQ